MSKITVGCRVHNGVTLDVYERRKGSRYVGTMTLNGPVQDGSASPAPVLNEVDESLYRQWLEENKTHTLVTSGSVYEVRA